MATSIWNRILRVDLSTGRIWTEQPGEAFYRNYPGGRNLIAYYLLTEVPRGIDAFDPENRLIFAPGPLTGVALPGAGRHTVGAKAPMTGLYGESESGGWWGAELKRAGWDAIIIQGKAAKPVYLWISDQEVELRDASHLWGKLTGDVQDQIREELGDQQIRITQIGPAGEKLVRFACIMSDLNEAAGRCGLGAVRGSKKLRAIATRGSQRVPVAEPEPINDTARWVARETLGEDEPHHGLHTWGTGVRMDSKQLEGHLITHNFRDGQLAGHRNIDGTAMKATVVDHMGRCFACPVACKKMVEINTPHLKVEARYGGPEYETFAAIGTNTGVTDLMAVCDGNQRINGLGLDSISTGAAIAWAMEMAELGILGAEELQGDSLAFGSAEDMVGVIDKIGRREGIGDLLADGTLNAARKIGKGAEQYVVQGKGLDAAMHDPRGAEHLRLAYAVAPIGADHCGSDAKRTSLRNTVGLCIMLQYDDDKVLDLLNAATGWDMSREELHEVFERGLTMTRLFNLREGVTTEDDELPWRFHQPMAKGPLSDYRLPEEEVREAVEGYYEQHGWERESGLPYQDTVEYLGLSDLAEALAELDLTVARPAGSAGERPFVMELD